MLDEKTRAILGDREAQEAITARGELLPCPLCFGNDIQVRKVSGLFGKSAYTRTYKYIQCRTCMAQTGFHGTEPKARKAWNHRPPAADSHTDVVAGDSAGAEETGG